MTHSGEYGSRYVSVTSRSTPEGPSASEADAGAHAADPATASTAPPRRARRRAVGLLATGVLLVVVLAASVAVGARDLALTEVLRGLTDPQADSYTVVREMRLPRTVLGLLTGAALGLAGAVMQSLTRNPLADPGLLGINGGAAAAVVSAISFLGVTSLSGYLWFAFAGAAAVSVLVWVVGGAGRATPARLVLAGVAVAAAMFAYVNGVQLLDTRSLDLMRFWTVGSLAAPGPDTWQLVAPFIAAGVVLALALARPLNALSLGDDSARALGARPGRTRAGAVAAVTLLCGAATAACGPISFVGLIVPHLVRTLAGPDLRWLLPYCVLVGPGLMLAADVLGRVLARPGEVQVGVLTAVLGGMFFMAVVRRSRGVAL